jgi:hypothetical protein
MLSRWFCGRLLARSRARCLKFNGRVTTAVCSATVLCSLNALKISKPDGPDVLKQAAATDPGRPQPSKHGYAGPNHWRRPCPHVLGRGDRPLPSRCGMPGPVPSTLFFGRQRAPRSECCRPPRPGCRAAPSASMVCLGGSGLVRLGVARGGRLSRCRRCVRSRPLRFGPRAGRVL